MAGISHVHVHTERNTHFSSYDSVVAGMTLRVRLNPPTAHTGAHRHTPTGKTRASANDSEAEKT